MDKKIYYCKECDATWAGDSRAICYCPDCEKNGKKIMLVETSVNQKVWHRMNDAAKKEKKKEFKEFIKKSEEVKEHIKKINDLYEYSVLSILDNDDGYSDHYLMQEKINEMAKCRWRLISVSTNEVGKNSNSCGYGGLSSGENATIDQTILIFERRLEKANN